MEIRVELGHGNCFNHAGELRTQESATVDEGSRCTGGPPTACPDGTHSPSDLRSLHGSG
jgi:hypothetical protein